jgi:hypothetical protein
VAASPEVMAGSPTRDRRTYRGVRGRSKRHVPSGYATTANVRNPPDLAVALSRRQGRFRGMKTGSSPQG